MKADKIEKFMALAGQHCYPKLSIGTEAERKLGAQLLLSEVLEYVIHGLGVIPEYKGTKIEHPDAINYHVNGEAPDPIEMLDGLSDTAYTMYWNSQAFALPLEEAFDAVCDNNLQKFVKLDGWQDGEISLPKEKWSCGQEVSWPKEVVKVEVKKVSGEFYAVGKDERGKVRKPSTYKPVDLTPFLESK